MTDRRRIAAYALLVFNMAIFGTHATVGRLAAGDIPPLALAFWRWLLAFLVLLPFAAPILRVQWRLAFACRGRIALVSLFMVLAFTTLFYVGFNDTTAINGGLLNAVVPVIVVLVTWLARDEHLSGRQALGLALSLFGVVVIVCRGHVSALWTLRFHLGDLILLAAMICFALYSLVVRRLPAGLHNLAVMVPAIAIALPALAGLYAWEFSTTGPFPLSTGNLVILAYVIFGPAIVGYFCWMYGVRAVGANRAAFTYNLIPVFTVITAALFAGERLEPYHWAGFALNFAGMYLALIPGRRGAAIDAPTA